MGNFWDERYSDKEYVYGTKPNEFFKAQLDRLNPGKLLLIGEGEGRNAVYAAEQGWIVDAVDSSQQARIKALNLAEQKKTAINYEVASLQDYIPGSFLYDAIGIIFVHMGEELSRIVHGRTIEALKPGGRIIMQVFEKEQSGKTSGGPQSLEQLYSLDDIKNNFEALTVEILSREIIILSEGEFHSGESVVINFVGVK
jgi:cyclopropane fatty-acyl-phospholipid synthase-like methyltransferase